MVCDKLISMKHQQPILFYDGVCHLCHGLVQFILRYEASPLIMFAQLQSSFAKEALPSRLWMNVSTVVFITNGRTYIKSSAVVRILWVMGGKWRFLGGVLWLIPYPIRHVGYVLIAKFRYRLFGRSDVCIRPKKSPRFILDP